MSVEPNDSMSESWSRWQGQVVNGAFRLGRYLGSSEHSGVFQTELSGRQPPQAVLKLVPEVSSLADAQLAEWRVAAGLAHPHLMPILASGRCRLGEQPYLYVVTEYADQNLAQILRQRALSEEEVREMLAPTLSALAFLHGKNLVHGQLKPANIMAVGDTLKLSCDSVRRIAEAGTARSTVSVYDPPEARDGSDSAAGDIWGLGVSVFEALTRTAPFGLDERRGPLSLPRDFPSGFREVVAACLNRRPFDRPKVAELEAWVKRRAGSAPVTTPQAAALAQQTAPAVPPRPQVREPARTASPPPSSVDTPINPRAVAPAAPPPKAEAGANKPPQPKATPQPVKSPPQQAKAAPQQVKAVPQQVKAVPQQVKAVPQQVKAPPAQVMPAPPAAAAPAPIDTVSRAKQWIEASPWLLIIGVAVALVLAWAGMRALRPATPPPPATAATPAAPAVAAPVSTAPNVAPATGKALAPVGAAPIAQNPGANGAAIVHEEVPEVPHSARRTIHGHIKVSVRVIVDAQGGVVAALVDHAGPSRYFERLAIEAAKKWTFAPEASEPRRLKLIRFEFSRDGTQAHALSAR